MRRVGLLGGTFDPPHIGHAIIADQVGCQLGLDEVRLVPANHPWQKDGSRAVTSAARRLEMTTAMLDDLKSADPVANLSPDAPLPNALSPELVSSDVELMLGGPSYTMVTLEHLWTTEPETTFVVVVGSDAAAGLPTWHRAEELKDAVGLAVVSRPGGDHSLPAGFDLTPVETAPLDISSTNLRSNVARDRSVRFLTTPSVIALVSEWGLYRPGL